MRDLQTSNEIGQKDTEDKCLETAEKKDVTVNKSEEY